MSNLDKKTRIFAESLYDTLFQETDHLLKQTNPCKIQNGRCKFQDKWSFGPDSRNGCCGACKNLDTQKGCLTQNLACKTFLCGSVSDENPILRSQLDVIAGIGYRFFYLHCYDAKEQLLSTFHIPDL